MEAGEYWTRPAMKDLQKMTRPQLKSVGNFVVGREGIGRIEFGNVDLTNTPLDAICGNIVQLNPRSATVYQDDANKPAMGKALNVPSTIFLENSWPRSHGGKKAVNAKSGREYEKHLVRLKRVGGTKFLNYDTATGVWSFTVDHFTTYALDDDDEDDSEYPDDTQMGNESSALSEPPETPTGEQDASMEEEPTPTGEMDDTFEFKINQRSQRKTPGGFDDDVDASYVSDTQMADETATEDQDPFMMSGGLGRSEMEDPFAVSGGPVQAPSPGAVERYHSSLMDAPADDDDEEIEDISQEIPGSFAEPKAPKSILKPSTAFAEFTSPARLAEDPWEEQLQRTLSPKKRDRQALRDMQQSLFRAHEAEFEQSPFKQSMLGQSALGQSYLAQKSAKKTRAQQQQPESLGKSVAFTSAKDIMDSLWSQEKPGKKQASGARGLEV